MAREGASSDSSATKLIYIARHGETPLNVASLLRGHLNPPLTRRGEQQAEALALALDDVDLRFVHVSPLRRATETASVVARRRGLEIVVNENFTDRDYGPWAGASLEDVVARWGSIDDAPGVEPRNLVAARAMRGLREVADVLGRGAALIVSHDAVNRLLLRELDSTLGDAIAQETGCYNVVDVGVGTWKVLSVNNVPPFTYRPR